MAKHENGTKVKIRDTDCVKREIKGILTDPEPPHHVEELAKVNPIAYATLQALEEVYRSTKMPEAHKADTRNDLCVEQVSYEQVLHGVSVMKNGTAKEIASVIGTYAYVVLPHLQKAVLAGDVQVTNVKSGKFVYPHYRRVRK